MRNRLDHVTHINLNPPPLREFVKFSFVSPERVKFTRQNLVRLERLMMIIGLAPEQTGLLDWKLSSRSRGFEVVAALDLSSEPQVMLLIRSFTYPGLYASLMFRGKVSLKGAVLRFNQKALTQFVVNLHILAGQNGPVLRELDKALRDSPSQ